MSFKFKKNDTAYLIVKHRFKPTEYIKCKIIMAVSRVEDTKIYCPYERIKTNIYSKYYIETNQSETSIYSRNNKNHYLEYSENQLLTTNECRAVKLRKLSGKKYLNFPGKKFFKFNYLISFLKK